MWGTVLAYGRTRIDKAKAGKRIKKAMAMRIPWIARFLTISDPLEPPPEDDGEPDVGAG